jgi:biotin carboxylase
VNEQPLLAVVHSPRSRPWTEIVDAAAGLCRLLWITDSRGEGARVVTGVLRKFGKVLDIADCNHQELLQLVHGEHPDGVTSYFDTDLHLQAWLAEALDLPSVSVRSAALLTDKLLQREALDAAGVPVPRFCEVGASTADDEAARLADALDFPLLLKPRDGTACRDISPVEDAAALAGLLGSLPHPSRMILEERMGDLPATEAPYADRLSIDSIVSRGVISHLGVTGLFEMIPPFRSSGGFFPAAVASAEADALFEIATASLKALGADAGCYRTEIKLTPDGLRIIEVNGRPTGLTPATVKLAAGLPLLELTMRLALGEHITLDGPLACQRVAYRYYAEPPMSAKRVLSVDGLDDLRAVPGVLEIDVHKGPRDPVDWRNGSLDKVFQVTGVVAHHAELAAVYRACRELVRVTYEHRSEDR